MSAIKDEEDLLKSIQAYVMANLNTKIIAINAEKTGFDIDQITADDDHYVYAGELLDLPNHDFVNFAIDGDIETENNHDDISSITTIMVEVAFDNPKKANTYFKSLRYMRALYETLLNYEASVMETGGLQITKATPMVVTSSRRQLVVSGVGLSVALG